MLVRRFAIVCLAATFAGGGLAVLVAESGRTPYSWKLETARACPFGVTADCLRLMN